MKEQNELLAYVSCPEPQSCEGSFCLMSINDWEKKKTLLKIKSLFTKSSSNLGPTPPQGQLHRRSNERVVHAHWTYNRVFKMCTLYIKSNFIYRAHQKTTKVDQKCFTITIIVSIDNGNKDKNNNSTFKWIKSYTKKSLKTNCKNTRCLRIWY